MSGSVQGTTNVWPNYSKGNTSAANGSNSLGKDDFLKILVAQLKHQDPMQPLQDREFIAQMTQFSSVEQIMNMANEMTLLRQSMGISSDLIGKHVSWNINNEAGTEEIERTGVVTAISFNEGNQFVIVGDERVSIDKLIKVWNEISSGTEEPVGNEEPNGNEVSEQ